MSDMSLTRLPVWQKLSSQAADMQQPHRHLKYLLQDEQRFAQFTRRGAGLFMDFSRQRLQPDTLKHLGELARECEVLPRFQEMMAGARINRSENRAALHTATRSFATAPLMLNGRNIRDDIQRVRKEIKTFVRAVHTGAITGSTGKPFQHLVVVGIGGSYLGTEFVATALAAYARPGLRLHYLANVDIHNFATVIQSIDPETTLWIMISKSYTTAETMANANQASEYMASLGLAPAQHLITVTSQGSPGDDPARPVLASFHMFDYIGGRYSVTSAVGGVPLSLLLGYEHYESFLKGAEAMDNHAATTPVEENLPLLAALIDIWNLNFMGYNSLGIIPYAAPLARLAPHIQQLNMESNGKSVTACGSPLNIDTGGIIFGEPGTNAQHSFFQLAHQGRPFPLEFIGILQPQVSQYQARSRGVTNHQELWANFLSQPQALAMGRAHDDPARAFSGNRPSSLLVLEELTPFTVGALLAFYEARTVFQAFIWNINPFDQFGVELGKTMAGDIRRAMARKNEDSSASFADQNAINRFYLEWLYRTRS